MMTPRERTEATAQAIADRWHTMTITELRERLETMLAEHVRALLAETPETMELLTYGPLDEEDARWTLATLRRKALGE